MILESAPWKKEIERQRALIVKWCDRLDSQRGYFIVERSIFFSAFAVRKLIENNKISDRTANSSIKFMSFLPFRPISDRIAGLLGVFDITKEYDFSKPLYGQYSVFDLCSEIMHSFVFVPEFDESEAHCFYVNSFRHQDKRLLRIALSDYTDLLSAITSDEVTATVIWQDHHRKIRARHQ